MTDTLDCTGCMTVSQLDHHIDYHALRRPFSFMKSMPTQLIVTECLARKLRKLHNLTDFDQVEHRTIKCEVR